jgi:hypothetical protein
MGTSGAVEARSGHYPSDCAMPGTATGSPDSLLVVVAPVPPGSGCPPGRAGPVSSWL